MIDSRKLIFVFFATSSYLLKSVQKNIRRGSVPSLSYILKRYQEQRDTHSIRCLLYEPSLYVGDKVLPKKLCCDDLMPGKILHEDKVQAILAVLNPANTIVALNSRYTVKQSSPVKKKPWHDVNNETVGFVCWNPESSRIIYLVVNKNCPEKELAAALISSVLQHQQKREGAACVQANIPHKSALPLYRSLGFKVNEVEILYYAGLGKIDATNVKKCKALWNRIENYYERSCYATRPHRAQFFAMARFFNVSLEELWRIKQVATQRHFKRKLVAQRSAENSYTAIFDDLQIRSVPHMPSHIVLDMSPAPVVDPGSVRSDSDLSDPGTEMQPVVMSGGLGSPDADVAGIQKACKIIFGGSVVMSLACSSQYMPQSIRKHLKLFQLMAIGSTLVYGATGGARRNEGKSD
jgi:hypothetical protein